MLTEEMGEEEKTTIQNRNTKTLIPKSLLLFTQIYLCRHGNLGFLSLMSMEIGRDDGRTTK